MNIVLLEPDEPGRLLPGDDPRTLHVVHVLRRRVGDSFDAGIIDGLRGKATIVELSERGMRFDLRLTERVPPLHPVTLVFGACRPVAAQRILREATSLGVDEIWTCGTDKAESSYLRASLWAESQWREHLVAGAAQAFSTRLPAVRALESVDDAIAAGRQRIGCEAVALDNYEARVRLREWAPAAERTILAVGPERGWSARERDLVRSAGWRLAGLGERVLRTETACVAGVVLVLARRALM